MSRPDGDRPEPLRAQPQDLRRWRRHLADERAEASVYRNLSTRFTGEEREILLGLAEAEERHIAHWEGLLGEEIGRPRRAALRIRLLALLARWFGSVFVLALAQRAETNSPYDTDADATPAMAADERVHEEVLRGLAARGRARVSGTFRAAVFGANDGLVSNMALVLGVSGGGVDTQTVLLTGIAGLLAGALSMAAGEYISVRSQRELLAASAPGTDAAKIVPHLDVDANELALVYRARGMAADEAQERADAALAGIAVESGAVGGESHEVVGTAVKAALSSFCFFASGALIPVLPFLFGAHGATGIVIAAVLTGIALMVTGGVVGILSGGSPLQRGLRQLAIGAGAAAITYVLGLAVGGAIG
ncbi:rubrerythrin family protein [Rhodococcus sp. D2-41]|uniref:VIT1/CCC1 family protein n=1 Tax=Speluncibacter jeojiensis TaxID=2710754 RepID=A0A9X4LZS7_9ACTN|nr:VIT1/CCC1 family protein [Rhodococcus sp. D2-41]MDG3009646.1 rubrerythrin family protein [Rhodococcus sp. D2-41]MDG3014395.1 VIT1/CCC1 family protein [Corynebacteriales bacterium D3-21]